MKEVITRNDVKIFITTVSIICVVVFAWADLKSAATGAGKEALEAKKTAELTAEKQDKMALDVVEIKTILKQRGFSASAFTPIPNLTPSPSNQSAQLEPQAPQTIVNNYTLPTPEPTPYPTPTPTEELCVLSICI